MNKFQKIASTLFIATPIIITFTDSVLTFSLTNGDSMSPTLENNDILLINKFVNTGYCKFSNETIDVANKRRIQIQMFTPENLELSTIDREELLYELESEVKASTNELMTRPIGKSDIVVLKPPDVYPEGNLCVKRVVKMEGDFVKVEENFGYGDGEDERRRISMKQLPHGRIYVTSDNKSSDKKFVDSETKWGPIPKGLVVGRVEGIVWPLSRARWFKGGEWGDGEE